MAQLNSKTLLGILILGRKRLVLFIKILNHMVE